VDENAVLFIGRIIPLKNLIAFSEKLWHIAFRNIRNF